MPNPFVPGDVVQLRSGGPQMTISSALEAYDGAPCHLCTWFEKGEIKQRAFPPAVLERYEPPAPFVL